MGIIGWILLGLIAGYIAKAMLPGSDPGGMIITTLILGGLVATALGFAGLGDFFELRTWVIAVLGSVGLLLLARASMGGSRHRYR